MNGHASLTSRDLPLPTSAHFCPGWGADQDSNAQARVATDEATRFFDAGLRICAIKRPRLPKELERFIPEFLAAGSRV